MMYEDEEMPMGAMAELGQQLAPSPGPMTMADVHGMLNRPEDLRNPMDEQGYPRPGDGMEMYPEMGMGEEVDMGADMGMAPPSRQDVNAGYDNRSDLKEQLRGVLEEKAKAREMSSQMFQKYAGELNRGGQRKGY